MAICDWCGKDMLEVDDCVGNLVVEYPDGVVLESKTDHFDEPDGRCHDCGAVHGKHHHPGCDVERCPRCGGQLISCGCLDESEEKMGADNWRTCPRCEAIAHEKRNEMQQRVLDGYGTMPRAEYLELYSRLQEPQKPLEENLREDYEVYIDGAGVFHCYYLAHCTECGFEFKFRHEQVVPME